MKPGALALVLLLAPPAGAAEVLFAGHDGRDWGLWSVEPGAAPQLRLAREVRSPVLSRSGRLAYADPAGRIWLSPPGAFEAAAAVTGLPEPCDQPSWNPDGTAFVVACFRFGSRQDDGALWLVPVGTGTTGGDPRLLHDGPGLQKSPVWSPDGSRIAFVSGFRMSAERVMEHVWVMQADGRDAHAVADAGDQNIDPAWLPDSAGLVWSTDLSGRLALWRLALDGTPPQPLTEGPADTGAAVAADGRIVHVGLTGGREALWLIRPGAAPEALTGPELASVRDPAWAGDRP